MPHPSPLPSELPDYFAVAQARTLGVPAQRLGRRDLHAPYRGVRGRGSDTASGDLRDQCLRYAPRLRPWQFFSHETALSLYGAPTPDWPYRPALHVSAHRPAREPRIAGVVGHRLQLREPLTARDAAGLPIEHAVRAWRQCGTLWGRDDLIAAGEFLVSGPRPLATVEELRDEVQAMGDTTRGLLRRALAEMRVGARSPRETRLRLLLVRAGLPHPEINWNLHDPDGRFVAELDLAYPRYRVCPEYDGRVHAEDPAQFARDADRWDRIRAAGWEHVRILNHHLRGSGAAAVEKVARALRAQGWRPGRL
ncbi:hypothetical protein [Microbacterium sp. SORGH_AS_0888]|uniref:hypothetical protein n=1 Tax=Microbacterium sp. SORGH_AS_0888 TaxID=3041791 RepID=UPI0027893CF9|nr:hypothetical protein [Microbacterium sp. SORGH_AS_0888]MDQ1129139.1 hypothetical protein [Microbacterium sp. SORGH_AS_0888]